MCWPQPSQAVLRRHGAVPLLPREHVIIWAGSLDLEAVRKNVDRVTVSIAAIQEQISRSTAQLTAEQELIKREIIKLPAIEQYVLYENSKPPPRPAPASARNSVLRPSQAHSGFKRNFLPCKP